jgi:transposase
MEYTTLSKESKMGKQQKTYTRELKMEAVQLVKGSGKPMIQVARNLEISDSALYYWSKQLTDKREQAFPGSGLYCSPKSYRRFVQQAIRNSSPACLTRNLPLPLQCTPFSPEETNEVEDLEERQEKSRRNIYS